MKNLILASLISVVSVSANAEAISAGLGTTATAVTILQGGACIYQYEKKECQLFTVSSIAAVLGSALKEEIAQVEADAHNFLAGEELSLALEQQLEAVRNASAEAAELSDLELAAVLIQISNS